MPVFSRKKHVLAVVQILNKRQAEGFTFQGQVAFRNFAEPLGLILESSLQMRR